MKNQKIPKDIIQSAKKAGLDIDNGLASAVYVFEDEHTVVAERKKGSDSGMIIMDIKDAIKKYPWVKDKMWSLLDKDKDEYTRKAYDGFTGGYFVWVKKGVRVDLPIQSCMMIREKGFEQIVHNIVMIEDGAHVNMLTGCFNHHPHNASKHIGMSEMFIGKGAYLNFTMVHDWGGDSFVRPKSMAVLDDGAEFISNYVMLSEVGDLQTSPVVALKGKASAAALTSLIYGQKGSKLDVGGVIDLKGKGSKANMVSRAIARDSSIIKSRGLIVGDDSLCKGHLECQGLLFSDGAKIDAVPELSAKKKGATLSHEAAVGKIAPEEIIYLMSRGLSRKKAIEVIVRGFLDVKILGLPTDFQAKIKALIDSIEAVSYTHLRAHET